MIYISSDNRGNGDLEVFLVLCVTDPDRCAGMVLSIFTTILTVTLSLPYSPPVHLSRFSSSSVYSQFRAEVWGTLFGMKLEYSDVEENRLKPSA